MSERAPDYAQGFKDGFAAGLEEGKKLAQKIGWPGYLGSPNCCSVCGKDFGNKIWGYVCSNANCPTRTIAYTVGGPGGAITGAVGTVRTVGANGPIGTMNDPYELGN